MVHRNQGVEAADEKVLGELGNHHARTTAVEALCVFTGAEYGDSAVGLAVGLLAFEYCLTVVQGVKGQTLLEGAVGFNATFVPTSVDEFSVKSVVSQS